MVVYLNNFLLTIFSEHLETLIDELWTDPFLVFFPLDHLFVLLSYFLNGFLYFISKSSIEFYIVSIIFLIA